MASNYFEDAYDTLDSTNSSGRDLDSDADGLTNFQEFLQRSDPGSPNIDGNSDSDPTESVTLALYSANSAPRETFGNNAFTSIDTDPVTLATPFSQGGGLTGGGARTFVLSRSHLNTSVSASPAYNSGSVTSDSQSLARISGDFFRFTVQANGTNVRYDSLSFFANQFDTRARFDLSYSINGAETFIARGRVPRQSNLDLSLINIDFDVFSSAEDVDWTFYLYGAQNELFGTRFDDIELKGLVMQPNAPTQCSTLTNIAPSGDATQSSTYSGTRFSASFAIDGNLGRIVPPVLGVSDAITGVFIPSMA